jgi:hypothetical protein
MAKFDTDKRAILSPCNEIHSIVVDALFIFGTKCERSNRHLTTSGLSKRRFAVGRAAKRTHFSFESSGQSSQPPVEFVSLRQICTAPNMPTYQQIIMTIPKCSGEYLVKQLLQFLVGELPTHNQDDIVLHEEWYRKIKFIANKYKESEATYTTARAELIADAKTALREYRDQRLETLEREREAEIHEKRRAEIHERLQEMLAQKEVLDADQRAERQKQEAALREKIAAQEEALRQERSEKKQQVLYCVATYVAQKLQV